MSRATKELAEAHAQLVALRDAIKATARDANRILARVERAMRSTGAATSSTKPRPSDAEGGAR